MYTTNICYEASMHNITPKEIENKETLKKNNSLITTCKLS